MKKQMKAGMLAAASAFLVGCTFADAQIRKSAAKDFDCPEDKIVLHGLPKGYLARGCWKEAEYLVQDGRVKRNSEIKKATIDERPPVPVDQVANTNSVGID
jgi:hypothetical protein